jgi:hypothetical protein
MPELSPCCCADPRIAGTLGPRTRPVRPRSPARSSGSGGSCACSAPRPPPRPRDPSALPARGNNAHKQEGIGLGGAESEDLRVGLSGAVPRGRCCRAAILSQLDVTHGWPELWRLEVQIPHARVGHGVHQIGVCPQVDAGGRNPCSPGTAPIRSGVACPCPVSCHLLDRDWGKSRSGPNPPDPRNRSISCLGIPLVRIIGPPPSRGSIQACWWANLRCSRLGPIEVGAVGTRSI